MTGIFFDLDGTLLDTLDDLVDGVNYALTQFGCPTRSTAYIRSVIGNGARNLVASSLPGTPEDPDLEDIFPVYQDYYASHCRIKTGPYAGIPAALKKICEKYPVAIISNKPDPAVRTLCADFFPGIYALGEMASCPKKPAPDMLMKVQQVLQVDSFLYVGDTEVDILTANNAGVKCLSVTWGFRDEDQLLAAGATHLCHRTEDLPDWIDKLIEEESYGK